MLKELGTLFFLQLLQRYFHLLIIIKKCFSIVRMILGLTMLLENIYNIYNIAAIGKMRVMRDEDIGMKG